MGQKPLDNLDLFDDLPNPVGRPKQFASSLPYRQLRNMSLMQNKDKTCSMSYVRKL